MKNSQFLSLLFLGVAILLCVFKPPMNPVLIIVVFLFFMAGIMLAIGSVE